MHTRGKACGAVRFHASLCAGEPAKRRTEASDALARVAQATATDGAGPGAPSQGEVEAWFRTDDDSAHWIIAGVDATHYVAKVLQKISMSNMLSLPAGTKADQFVLYALVDAHGKLVKEEPEDMTTVPQQLLKASKPLAGQLKITAADVAGGYFVVKKAPLKLTRTCIAALPSVYATDW
jgi:hypothetical protein